MRSKRFIGGCLVISIVAILGHYYRPWEWFAYPYGMLVKSVFGVFLVFSIVWLFEQLNM